MKFLLTLGGSFLVTGSSDNYIRVYLLYPDQPEKIAELPNHGVSGKLETFFFMLDQEVRLCACACACIRV